MVVLLRYATPLQEQLFAKHDGVLVIYFWSSVCFQSALLPLMITRTVTSTGTFDWVDILTVTVEFESISSIGQKSTDLSLLLYTNLLSKVELCFHVFLLTF